MARSFKRSPLALAVLALLFEAPMHPYRMQQLIRERNKDAVINVEQRASLYQTIGQLEKAGLIRVRETVQDENRPERSVYELTNSGYQTAQTWMREALSTPAQEYPEFPAALSFIPLLTPEDTLKQLEKREIMLNERHARVSSEIVPEDVLPRLFILESEYVLTVLEAEIKWVRSLIDDLRSGALTWNNEWLLRFIPPDSEE